MKLLLVAVIAVCCCAVASGLFLGQGGVYDSPQAQAYWNRRFGKGVLSAARAAAKSYSRKTPLTQQQQVKQFVPVADKKAAAKDDQAEEEVAIKNKIISHRRPRIVYYVPRFAGTYAPPSPYWTRRNNNV